MTSASTDREQLEQLQRAALALKRMRARLDTLEREKTEPLAIIGLGCRLPGRDGNICGPDDFWRLLHNGEDAIGEVPLERWDSAAYYDPDPDAAGKIYTRWGGFLRDIDQFDAGLFGVAPREAVSIDPQQRLLLEVAWEALEHAGQAPDMLKQTRTGIFIGIGIGDYGAMQLRPDNSAAIDAYTGTGSGFCFASGRLAYLLGTQGPSLSVDTACSSSLVAIHLACQSLRSRECRMALAGGVNAMLAPEAMLFLAKSRALSPTGRCRTFDAAADGFVRGEGCGVLVLKRLSDALADGDTVLALICGSAVNHDGPSSGLTVPNGQAQQTLLRQALEQAAVAPADVDYIEAHGTGTSLGDPIEVRALGAVLGAGRAADARLLVGSVKTNIGHLEAAAGVSGVIKVVLALQNGEIPPHLHFHTPTPHIPWDALPVAVPTTPTPWPRRASRRRIAGVSSFGLSGTNAHVLLAEAPPSQLADGDGLGGAHVLALSTKGEPALRALADRYARHLANHPVLSLADFCFTANAGRAYLSHHLAAVATSADQLRDQLSAFVAGQPVDGVVAGRSRDGRQPKIAFLCTGQGAQYVGMGKELYATQPVFRQALDRCAGLLRRHLGIDLREVLYPETTNDQRPTTDYRLPTTDRQGDKETRRQGEDETQQPPIPALSEANGSNLQSLDSLETQHSTLNTQNFSSILDQTQYTQPALVALEYALAELWRSWGVEPTVLLGHSLGEYAAACIAGIWSLEDGLRLVVERARLMQALPRDGGMLSAYAAEARVRAAIAPFGEELAVAALNGPQHVVISGRQTALEQVAAQLEASGVRTRRLAVSYAFHSPLMRPILDQFAAVARSVTYTAPRIDMIADLSGEIDGARLATPQYWIDHVLQPVQFAAGVQALQRRGYGIAVEVGPRPVLLGMARQCLPEEGATPWLWLPSLRAKRSDQAQVLESAAALHANGVRIDWNGFYQPYTRRKLALPTYPFQRQRYWSAPVAPSAPGAAAPDAAMPPGRRVYSPAFTHGEVQFEFQLDRRMCHLLADRHSGQATPLDAVYLELARTAGAAALGCAAVLVEDLAPQQPLELPEDGARTLHILLEPAAPSAYCFQISSCTDADTRPVWLCHALGTVRAALPVGARTDWQRWLYQVAWRPVTANSAVAPTGAWLILADQGGAGRELAALLRSRGAACATAHAGARLEQTAADSWVVDPAAPDDMWRLVVGWADTALAPLAGVVYLWGLDAPFSAAMAAAELEQGQALACGGLLNLAQGLVRLDRPAPPRLWLVTCDSQPVVPAPLQPHTAPLWGLGLVIALEHPELRCTCVDIDGVDQTVPLTLLDELGAADAEQRVAFRGSQRFAARLAAYTPAEEPPAPVRADGTYLITGGLGALGLGVARWLAEQGAAALVLLGRRAPDPAVAAVLAQLEQRGTRMLAVPADVADAAALAAALADIEATLPPLRGIVHAAGVLDDATLSQQTWERFRRVMAPKVAGAWNLHTLTADLALDFFVCFSSVASTFGSPGQANYAAANAFLDGLAHYRRALGLPATTINWGPWAGGGMEAGNRMRRFAQGLDLIQPEQGLDILGRLLDQQAPQVCVLPVDWARFLPGLPPGGLPAFFAEQRPPDTAVPAPTLRSRLAALPADQRRNRLLAQVRAVVAQVLGVAAPEQIDPRDGLFELGIDSLMALDLKSRLEVSIGSGLRQTFVFDHPNIAAIVEYISQEVLPDLFQAKTSAREQRSAELVLAADLAQLSDAAAEALLLEELDRLDR